MTVIGATLGNYRVQQEIGHGGMGVVYVAEHPLIGRKVAVKVLLPDYSRNQEVVSRFFNEARATALIKHPGLVDVLDFGYDASGSAYLVMEFLDGESLGARLERETRLGQPLLINIARQATSAVGAAHQQGIIHRDLKPDNLFLVPDSEVDIRVKILDFGIAKLTLDDTPAEVLKTRTGAVMGTPLYMSPEQAGGAGKIDPRTDIYSLGCILFEMACGRPPFVKGGVGETIAAHIYEPPPSPRSLEPSISPALEAVILRALAKNPDERQQTMVALRAELDDIPNQDRRLAAPPPTAPAAAAVALDELPARNRLPLLPLAVGALVLVGAIAVVLGVRRAPPPADKPLPPIAATIAQPAPPAIQPAPPVEKPPAAAKPPDKVQLRIDSQPPSADVFRVADGVLVGTTPLVEELNASSGKALFLIKHAGFKDARAELPADRDGSTMVKMERVHGDKKVKPPVSEKPVPSKRIRDGAYDPLAQ